MRGRIRSAWESFKTVLPKDAPETQVTELRRAFYAGVQSMRSISLELTMMSEDSAVTELEMVHAELDQFAVDVRLGRA